MSTFNGIVSEFPEIRIDFFRRHPDAQPPLACFLSHVHSDHLAGLETLRSPFVYCSAATREILLRLERYPCRINYAKGVLEARQQTYKHLSKVLKPLPLDTTTTLELRPGYSIQVTLFDANHCPGSVMFLIEGQGKAVLYTGDIRSEAWFVNKLCRSPNLIQYTSGMKRLDKIYLDTSFTENVSFQPRAHGLAELLRKVARYPKDTVFHFQAWTYGYEEVWIALSRALESPIHVDDYKLRIYDSLRVKSPDKRFSSDMHLIPEAPALTGYMCGNSPHPGCLTSKEDVRLHSCEKGNMCDIAKGPNVVKIQPIVAHLDGGGDIVEMGVGGGGEDLEREAELDCLSKDELATLVEMVCSPAEVDADVQATFQRHLEQAAETGRNLNLDIDLSAFGDDFSMTLEKAINAIIQRSASGPDGRAKDTTSQKNRLPRVIRFPYSRHSSYPELCELVEAFKPKDVWPCTVDPNAWISRDISIRSLFGKHCSGEVFEHDLKMNAVAEVQMALMDDQGAHSNDTQETFHSAAGLEFSPLAPRSTSQYSTAQSVQQQTADMEPDGQTRLMSPLPCTQPAAQLSLSFATPEERIVATPSTHPENNQHHEANAAASSKRGYDQYIGDDPQHEDAGESQRTDKSFTSVISTSHSHAKWRAYTKALDAMATDDWGSLGLLSTDDNHGIMECEL